ncbi:MAG: hypothetical protein IPL40_14900 [Proteobacteria bacterium]|nr:hypothetical protein [Pseudomonadota bacterium]
MPPRPLLACTSTPGCPEVAQKPREPAVFWPGRDDLGDFTVHGQEPTRLHAPKAYEPIQAGVRHLTSDGVVAPLARSFGLRLPSEERVEVSPDGPFLVAEIVELRDRHRRLVPLEPEALHLSPEVVLEELPARAA